MGKSTFLSVVTSAKPKIANYHFTTIEPNLGVVKTSDNRSFVVADLPGLIEGASLGEGLGDKFLKHIERTRVIAHVIDMSGYEGRDPYDDYIKIKKELNDFDSKLLKKEQLIIANKMDMENAKENLIKFKNNLKEDIKIFEISAINEEGLDKVLLYMADLLDKEVVKDDFEDDLYEDYVLYTFKKENHQIFSKDIFQNISTQKEKKGKNLYQNKINEIFLHYIYVTQAQIGRKVP
mgnify:CR=1 FL=1